MWVHEVSAKLHMAAWPRFASTRLWTSALTLSGGGEAAPVALQNDVELCSMINAALRGDAPDWEGNS